MHGVHPAATRLQGPQLDRVLAHIVELNVLALAEVVVGVPSTAVKLQSRAERMSSTSAIECFRVIEHATENKAADLSGTCISTSLANQHRACQKRQQSGWLT